MIKLLFCLLCAFAMGVATLHLRQQQLELRHEAARYQAQIESHQAKLWDQQLQIAAQTAPNVLKQTLSQHHLPVSSPSAIPAEVGNWVGAQLGTR